PPTVRFCTSPSCREDRDPRRIAGRRVARRRTTTLATLAALAPPALSRKGRFAYRSTVLNPEQRAHRKPRHDAIHRETDGEAAGAIERISRDDGHRAQHAGIRKMTDREQSAKMFFRPEYFRQSERKK